MEITVLLDGTVGNLGYLVAKYYSTTYIKIMNNQTRNIFLNNSM